MKKRKMFRLLFCTLFIISLLLPVNSFAEETALLTGENEAEEAVIEVGSVEELFEKYGEKEEQEKQMTVTIPAGETVYVTEHLGFHRGNVDGCETVVLTGGGTLVPKMEDITLSMLAASAVDLVLDNVVLDGRNQKYYAPVVYGLDGSTITMNGGKICNFSAYAKAIRNILSAVYVQKSEFIMNGGIIEGMDMEMVLLAEGNSIPDVIEASIIMNGGVIENNQSVYGTVNLRYMADFTMKGGTIRNNVSQYGGAVFVGIYNGDNQVNLLGGTVSGNRATKLGDGIYFAHGNPVVLGQDCTLEDEIYFGSAPEEDAYLLLPNGLTRDVTVSYYDAASYLYEKRVVAKGSEGYAIKQEDAPHILIGNGGYGSVFSAGATDEENTVVLSQKNCRITFDVDGKQTSKFLSYGTRPVYDGETDRPADEEYVYTFAGWEDEDGVFYDGLLALARKDMTYTAVYDKTSFRDSFLQSVEAIGKAPMGYSELTGNQLLAAEEAYAMLSEKTEADKEVEQAYAVLCSCQRVWETLKKIEALPDEITLLQRTVILEARKAYDALSAKEKAMVADEGNFGASYQKLVWAESVFAGLARIQTVATAKREYTVYVNGTPVSLGAWTDGDSSQIRYTSSNPGVVAVDEKGYVTAVKGGTATITVQVPETEKFDASNIVNVTVTAKKAAQTIRSYAVYNGRNFKLTTTTDGDGAVSYQSLNQKVATVDSQGNVKAVGVGTVVIRVSAAATSKYEPAQKEYTFDIVAAYGATYTVGGVKYKVTNANIGGDGTVRVEGLTTSAKKVIIGDKVTIGNHSYKITAIKAQAFKNNKKMTSIRLGKNVTSIGKQAFYGCKKLAQITIQSKKLKTVGSKAFQGIKGKAVIKVPKGKLTVYKKLLKGKGQGKNVTIKR